MKKIAVILSGCGYLDGAEITESVSLLINLSKLNANYDLFAPDKNFQPAAHLNSDFIGTEPRNVLEESSRIARGNIKSLNELNPEKYDGLAFPGGYGVAKNLCTWAQDGASCSVDTKTKEAILNFHDSSKPILAICIAPALISKVLGRIASGLTLTIGSDEATAEQIEKTGTEHVDCPVEDFITDRANKVVSTPAYMFDTKPHQVFQGVSKATQEFIEMC